MFASVLLILGSAFHGIKYFTFKYLYLMTYNCSWNSSTYINNNPQKTDTFTRISFLYINIRSLLDSIVYREH